jgi:hypothetical protein
MAGADVGSDRGKSCPIGQVSHGRDGRKKEEMKQEEDIHLSNGMLSFVLPLLYSPTTVLARAKGRDTQRIVHEFP